MSIDDSLPFRLFAFPSGKVVWEPFLQLVTSCDMDLTYFPFDKQSCYIRFSNWVYGRYLNMTIDEKVYMNYYTPNPMWNIISAACKQHVNVQQDYMDVQFVLRREPRYFVINIILPTFSLSILSAFVFLIQVEAEEKLSVSVTILMSYYVILLLLADNVPRDGKIPIIS